MAKGARSTRKVRSCAATNDKVVGGNVFNIARGTTGGQDLSLFDQLLGDDHRATAATTRKDSEGEDSEEGMTEYGLADLELGFDELIAEHADDGDNPFKIC